MFNEERRDKMLDKERTLLNNLGVGSEVSDC